MSIVNFIKEYVFNPFGIDVKKYPSSDLRRQMQLFNSFRINKVLDVGANTGQYAALLRKLGYKGEIISFEPLTEMYKILSKNADKDNKWSVYNFALGDTDTIAEINISSNFASSSLLNITKNSTEVAPQTIYIGKEKIKVFKLDSINNDIIKKEENVFLKIDAQGYGHKILKGAENILKDIVGIQIEMSLLTLYEDEMLINEMLIFLSEKGFKLYSLENGFFNPNTGQLLQVDGIFFRENSKI